MKVLFSLLILSLFACVSDSHSLNRKQVESSIALKNNLPILTFPKVDPITADTLDLRSDIKQNLLDKKEKKIPLVVHAFVPLCDNEHQGIVPTSESLGNGFSLRSNLYWATSNGLKRYFVEHNDWKVLKLENPPISDTLLERVVFEKSFDDCKVVLICDAYRGDMMEPCLNDYLSSLAGQSKDSIKHSNSVIDLDKDVDMVVLNGHNGLMDTDVDPITRNPEERFYKRKDAVVIACASKSYFIPHFVKTDSYPLVTTNSLLYPGAFVLDGIIDEWAQMESEEKIKDAAGDAYDSVKKCGQQAARNMFSTGW